MGPGVTHAMANPTTQVPSTVQNYEDTKFYWPVIGGATVAKTYQTGEMIGKRGDGYCGSFDDTVAMKFLGLCDETVPFQITADDANGAKVMKITRPYRIEMPLDSGTVSRVSNINALMYAADSGHASLASGSFANIIGTLADVSGAGMPNALTGAIAVIAPLPVGFASAPTSGAITATSITGDTDPLTILGLAGSSSAGGLAELKAGAGNLSSNAGGAAKLTGGAGSSTTTGGVGGAATVAAGAGGGTASAGGVASITGGAGAGTGAGGAATHAGGASGSGATGNGGAASVTGGAALSTNGAGGAASLVGGVATGTGVGGAVTITSGASGGASGTAGAVNIDAGSAASGTAGVISVGPTNAASVKIGGGGTERAAIKGILVSGTIAVAVPTIADAETDIVAVSIAAMTFAAAVGDAVIAIPLEALPTDCVFNGAWVSATDEVTISFGTKEGGSGVTGANKNFKFLIVDLT